MPPQQSYFIGHARTNLAINIAIWTVLNNSVHCWIAFLFRAVGFYANLPHMSKQPPLADYVTVAAAAEWLTDGDRTVNSEDLLSLAIERKLVLSLEFIDPWPASRVEITYLAPDMAEIYRKVRKSATDHQDLPVEPIDNDAPKGRYIKDGPTLPGSDPPAKAIFLQLSGEFGHVENVVDLFPVSYTHLTLPTKA